MITIAFMVVCCILIWIAFFIGYRFISKKNAASIKFEKFLWNSRIDKMQYPPFTWVMKFADKKTQIFSFIVLLFELGSFATSCGLGLFLITTLIFNGVPLLENVDILIG